MRVLLDTNVLASAIATRGLCADVLRVVLAEHQLLLCDQICAELDRVLADKFDLPAELIAGFAWLLRRDALHVQAGHPPAVTLDDSDDLGILAAAVAGRADVLVTGDRELQRLGGVAGIAILSPRQFWTRLRSPPP